MLSQLATVEEALALARVRNECRHWMTGSQEEIAPDQQRVWFESVYMQQHPQTYTVWLLKDEGRVIGYFAAHKREDGLYITEGIAESWRGHGLGYWMLQTMICHLNELPLYADILNHNAASLALHRTCGFTVHAQVTPHITRLIRRSSC